jgi:hypothetical protein
MNRGAGWAACSAVGPATGRIDTHLSSLSGIARHGQSLRVPGPGPCGIRRRSRGRRVQFSFRTKPTVEMGSSAAASQRAEKVGTRGTSEKSQGDRDGLGGRGVCLGEEWADSWVEVGTLGFSVTTNGDKLESMTPPSSRYSLVPVFPYSRFPQPRPVINFRRERRHGSVEGNSFGPGQANCHDKRGLAAICLHTHETHRATTASSAPHSA